MGILILILIWLLKNSISHPALTAGLKAPVSLGSQFSRKSGMHAA